jgi:two-component system CheB/CheR fusion protein
MMRPEGQKKRKGRAQPKRQQAGSNSAGDPKTGELGHFPVAALGASAGGLEAFTQFFRNIPQDSGIAFILVQHLDPSQPSRLTEILGSGVSIPVMEVTEGTRVQPDHIYVIPPGKIMTISDRTLSLEEQPKHPSVSHSIDIFFRSLAEDVKERAVAIILSGAGSDGTDGARAIKARQGLVIVQDPATAKYDSMPRAALDAGVGDYILPPEAMIGKLMGYVRKSYQGREDARQALGKDDQRLRNILSTVRARTGRDFSGYKISSISRRVERRMAVHQVDTVEEYSRLLQEQPAEIEELVKDFLINVTSFFRDGEAFKALKNEIGNLLKDRPAGSLVRAWIPGCSTGEEAYSVAMLLTECAEELKRHYDIQVFATDLDGDAIAVARVGKYPSSIAQDVDEERLKRFFSRVDESYQVKKDLREKLVFALHDLVLDPPYSRMDIVSVRNLLIYFDSELQKKVLHLLHYSVNGGGILFLGTAETIGEFSDLFNTVDNKWRIYRGINGYTAFQHYPLRQPAAYKEHPSASLEMHAASRPGTSDGHAPEQLLLEALPPSVLVDRAHTIVYSHGNTRKYLHLPEGKPSISLLEMAAPELREALATALYEAAQEQKQVIREGLRLKHNGGTQSVRLTVRPVSRTDRHLIITFEDIGRQRRRRKKGEIPDEQRFRELEQELQITKETLRGIIEQLETASEEHRSINEEYVSTNEELRSANEELETSREELRSVNEELVTINTEREKKIEELTAVSDDMRNLLNSTGIATIFLDEDLRIRRFTPTATALFKFQDSDVGRPVEDITSRLKTDSLPQVARRVLDTLVPEEQEVQTRDGGWYTMRVHPYRTAENAIDGVVASFADISEVKAVLSYADAIIGTLREPFVVLDENLKVKSASRTFYKTFQVLAEDTEGQLIYDLGSRQWDIPQLRQLLKDVLQEDRVFDGFPVEHDFPGIGHRVMLLNARRVYEEADATQLILLAMEDISDRARLEPFSEREDFRKRGDQ